MSSIVIIKQFLIENNIDLEYLTLLDPRIKKLYDYCNPNINLSLVDASTDIVYCILCDLYKLYSENIKLVSKDLKKMNIQLGRFEKELLHKYYCYKSKKYLVRFIDCLDVNGVYDQQELIKVVEKYNEDKKLLAQSEFRKLWDNADEKHKEEYLFSIFSKLYHIYELKHVKLIDIYNYNIKYLHKELSKESIESLRKYCLLNNTEGDISDIAILFYKKYMELLKKELQEASKNKSLDPHLNQEYIDENILKQPIVYDRNRDLLLLPTEEYGHVHITLNQKLFDKFGNKYDFYNDLLDKIHQIYRILDNTKAFSVKIENIYDEQGENIKWDLYSLLGIYCENFIRKREYEPYYRPEIIFNDTVCSPLNIQLSNNDLLILRQYYKNKITLDELIEKVPILKEIDNYKEKLDEYHHVYYGFMFSDCFILKNKHSFPNPNLEFITNRTDLLMIFYKYRIDNKKIPCILCGGLKISGNSFPEIGLRSWECKNDICPSRSKSNRGKRYSKKSNYMQLGYLHKNKFNIIPKKNIEQWRRDIVDVEDDLDIYDMIIRYYSFAGENLLFINADSEVLKIGANLQRKIQLVTYDKSLDGYVSPVDVPTQFTNIYDEYFNKGKYISRFLIDKKRDTDDDINSKLINILNEKQPSKLIHGDCYRVLSNMPSESITSAVTSPPYYNAREYSQWNNLYLYLTDMYNIIKEMYRVLKPGGVFLFNIGDISGNENTVVKSNMGKKRIILGAYILYLFKKVGFELLDNIIWDKGEPQSNRHKNDGKFTPHYQKPINCYEHMFIFKKPGNLILNKQNIYNLSMWRENVVTFPPVIKINLKGENTHGHSAPFPEDIPNFVARVFNATSNDIMLDPFSGSGTSIVSAYKNNIKGIGIEINNEYVQLSSNKCNLENIPVKIYII